MRKKKWETPVLAVIVRGKPEEAVIAACKTGYGGTVGPYSSFQTCTTMSGCNCGCAACSAS